MCHLLGDIYMFSLVVLDLEGNCLGFVWHVEDNEDIRIKSKSQWTITKRKSWTRICTCCFALPPKIHRNNQRQIEDKWTHCPTCRVRRSISEFIVTERIQSFSLFALQITALSVFATVQADTSSQFDLWYACSRILSISRLFFRFKVEYLFYFIYLLSCLFIYIKLRKCPRRALCQAWGFVTFT